MASEPTISAKVQIDVSPDGITFLIEGLDSDMSSLILSAGKFEVAPLQYHTYDTHDVTLKSVKSIQFVDREPLLLRTGTNDEVKITALYSTDEWWNSLYNHTAEIYVDNDKVGYFADKRVIVLDKDIFSTTKSYVVSVEVAGYTTSSLTVVIT